MTNKTFVLNKRQEFIFIMLRQKGHDALYASQMPRAEGFDYFGKRWKNNPNNDLAYKLVLDLSDFEFNGLLRFAEAYAKESENCDDYPIYCFVLQELETAIPYREDCKKFSRKLEDFGKAIEKIMGKKS